MPIRDLINQGTDRFVLTLVATAAFVLLLACANVGNLQLARITGRQKELAVRSAVGAGRFRIARQLAAESVVMAVLGGGLGLILADWNLAYNKTGISPAALRWVAGLRDQRIDGDVIAFTLVLSVLTGILCMVPAVFQMIRRRDVLDLSEALKESGRGASSGPRRSRLRTSLATFEVAMALILLVGAGLMVSTFQRMLHIRPGFDTSNLLTMQVALPNTAYRTGIQVSGFYEKLLTNLQAIPEVKAAGAAGDSAGIDGVFIQGRPEPLPGEPRPGLRAVSADYFEALRLPILRGRAIVRQDSRESLPVVVVSESIARHYWPKSDPVGQRIRFSKADPRWLTVAGVCGDVKDWFLELPQPAAYVPSVQSPVAAMTLYMRTGSHPDNIAGAARAAVRAVDAGQPVFDVQTVEQSIVQQTGGVHAAAVTMGTYALIALILSVTGIYGVISCSVVQRTHEIGVRMALGADRAEVLKLTMRQTLRIAGVGLGIGLPVAVLLTRLMSSVLYNVVAVDPLVFGAITGILGSCALLAGYLPARRAASIDPLTALRDE